MEPDKNLRASGEQKMASNSRTEAFRRPSVWGIPQGHHAAGVSGELSTAHRRMRYAGAVSLGIMSRDNFPKTAKQVPAMGISETIS